LGGEGQRVRLGRALLRRKIRLTLLDEPFRGLDRQARSKLLKMARQHWSGCTLLCVTHDVSETLEFDRVVIIEEGRIREVGIPIELASDSQSRYRSMLGAEKAVREELWDSPDWIRMVIEDGRLQKDNGSSVSRDE
jgi:ABC-type transport system involved in cytochrome bd biosynthesis fused ATPase/permease subunit